MNNHMIYPIVDNRTPAAVPYWPAFAAWWASRRCLVGPQDERTDMLWICADATTGLHKVPYCWAGVFVLEAASRAFRRVDLLVSRARSPVNPSDTVMSGTLFTPFVGIAM